MIINTLQIDALMSRLQNNFKTKKKKTTNQH